MIELPTAYPLAWPDNIVRSDKTVKSQFRTTLPGALKNVKDSLYRFGDDTGRRIDGISLSSNVGGLDPGHIADKGVAAWFVWDGELRCIAVDRYDKVEDNLQAIHHILEARRTEMRHGGLNIVRQTFKAFAALPSPPGSRGPRSWSSVLGVAENATVAEIDAAYKRLAAVNHPDKGGSAEEMAAINAARAQGRRARA